ncbi:hypothetical protein CCMA1212_004641 [Trichoderma ghanense]|uniref:Uncharacterized protein n=1 Tax=Trichoderma ghanense TaxID=65468 RepID=A0ABY2H932_9HYPO
MKSTSPLYIGSKSNGINSTTIYPDCKCNLQHTKTPPMPSLLHCMTSPIGVLSRARKNQQYRSQKQAWLFR